MMAVTAIGGTPAHWKSAGNLALVIVFVSACLVFGFFYAVLHTVWQELGTIDWDNPAGEPAQYSTVNASED